LIIRFINSVSGGVVYVSNYEPYGPGSGESGSEEYRYTGKRVDPTGLCYYGARYYDPIIGRFTTRDKVSGDLTDPQSLNGYSYCRNNPHKYTDPDGRLGMLAAWAIGTGAYTVLHVLSSLKKYEQNRNPLMTKEYHNWERNRVIVKETTRGMIRGGLTIAAFVATKSYDVPNPKTATASTYVVADIIAGPASAGVGMVYDTITDGPCSAETHNYEILEEAVTPIFTATDQIKERVIDPVLDKNPSLKIAVDELYDDIKSSMTYWVLGSITDTSYDYIERKRGA
jgi:RHS repeat-associated protein